MLFVTHTFYKLDARIYQIHKYQKCRNEVYYKKKNKKIKEHVNSLLFFFKSWKCFGIFFCGGTMFVYRTCILVIGSISLFLLVSILNEWKWKKRKRKDMKEKEKVYIFICLPCYIFVYDSMKNVYMSRYCTLFNF